MPVITKRKQKETVSEDLFGTNHRIYLCQKVFFFKPDSLQASWFQNKHYISFGIKYDSHNYLDENNCNVYL